jgi:hypothetical protein
MALMPIKHKHPVLALLRRFCLPIKGFKSLKACIVISSSVGSRLDDPAACGPAGDVARLVMNSVI